MIVTGSATSGLLAPRVVKAAEVALARQGTSSVLVDVLLAIGWLDPERRRAGFRAESWDSIESAIQVAPSRLSEALDLLGSWALEKGLMANEAQYVDALDVERRRPCGSARKRERSRIERLWRTHLVPRPPPERKRQQMVERASQALELLVISPLNDDWKCYRCGRRRRLADDGASPAWPACAAWGSTTWSSSALETPV